MPSILQIKIPCKPLTTNHIYGRSRFGSTFLKKEAKDFKKIVSSLVKTSIDFKEGKHFISVEYYFYLTSLYTKAGRINKKSIDLDNCLKILQDSIFNKLGINDAFILDQKSFKRYGEKDCIIVIIRAERIESLTFINL